MSQTNSPILAKSSEKMSSPISLAAHTNDVLNIFEKIRNKVKNEIQNLIQIAIVCHDWGKVLPVFQIKTLKNKKYNPNSPLVDFPHSLFSILWIDKDKLQERLSGESGKDYVEFVVSAIAYHHWRENFFEILIGGDPRINDLLSEINGQLLDKLCNNLIEEVKQLGNNYENLLKFDDNMAKGLCNGVPFYEYAHPPYQLYFLPKRIGIDEKKMLDWILISGFLQRVDHFASFCEEEGLNVQTEEPEISSADFYEIQNKVEEEIKKKIAQQKTERQDMRIWQLGKIKECKDKNIILIAPTGYGKTEFAFLWGSGEKFFYTLPLRAAVNQIYNRAVGIFGQEKSGLLHSDADVFLLGDGGESQANMRTYDLSRQLAFPTIISTGDQFFPYALRPPGYEKIYATFSYSRLVIDEVQAYDPRAAAIVVKFIEDVVRMGGKFLLMTATLPEFVRKEIEEKIGKGNFEEINLYEDEEKKSDFESIRKHRIKVELIENDTKDGKIDFSLPIDKLVEILNKANEGKRVLVIVNTVKQAQNIFEELNNLIEKDPEIQKIKIWLLHSGFTQENRDRLEREICGDKEKGIKGEFQNPKDDSEKKGKILVATQVVEASLDIDADVLFTEIAPMDTLVQRMGRVLRRYGPMTSPDNIPKPEEPNVFIWVYKNGLQSGKGYVYDNDLVLLTLKLLKDKKDKSTGLCSSNCKEWFQKKNKETKEKNDKLISSIIDEIFSIESKTEGKSRGGKQSKNSDDNFSISLRELELVCSEYDKYDLVKKLYESLPEDSSYLIKFYKTKDILDAGYMSDRKEEAHKLFREIHTVPIIPLSRENEFLSEIKNFLEKTDSKTYAWFKKEVLAKFIVHIPLHILLRQKEYGKSTPVSDWLTIQEIDENDKKKLIRWCQDIYFLECEYNSRHGIMGNLEEDKTFIL